MEHSIYRQRSTTTKFCTEFKRKVDTYTKDIIDFNTMNQAFSKTTFETANENIPLKLN